MLWHKQVSSSGMMFHNTGLYDEFSIHQYVTACHYQVGSMIIIHSVQPHFSWLPITALLKSCVEFCVGFTCAWTIQVHYTNMEGEVDLPPDNSGFQLTYTDQLRPHDMGIMTLTQMDLVLPPGQPAVVAPASVCPAACTAKLGSTNLTMMYSFLHMHQAGKNITTQHFRNGVELPPLGKRR